MGSQAGSGASPGAIIARLDRIRVWSLPYLFVWIIGLGFLFTFYDIFDINVSFIQTCSEIVPKCSPVTAAQYLGLPVLLNLVGYVIGSLVLGPLADRFGRRDMLLVTMLITGLGSLWTVFTNDYTMFTAARVVTGIGIGADLAIVNTYINEVAPREGRAKYTSLIFIASALGAFFGIWLGLLLTTPPTAFPLGLPFAVAGPGFGAGWRVMYAIGALLALIGVLLRLELPESPRWLISRGRTADAEAVVERMERLAERRGPLAAPPEALPLERQAERAAFSEIFGNPVYLKRMLLLMFVWLTGYAAVYSIASGLTVVLAALHYPPPEAGMIAAVGTFGFILCALFAYGYGESMERRRWLPVSAALTLIGGFVIAAAGTAVGVAFIGSIIIFIGFNLWVPMTYAWSAENFPTRARTTGFALVDGIGHVGGGIALMVIAPLIPVLGEMGSLLLMGAFLVVAAIIAQFGITTRNLRLDEVSP